MTVEVENKWVTVIENVSSIGNESSAGPVISSPPRS
jgi:hypothetical protein